MFMAELRRVLGLLPNETRRGKGRRTRRVARPGDWPIVRHDAHPGYISWEQFLRNQQRLDDNCTSGSGQRRGAVREGNALLQGLVLCGKCGRKMSVRYSPDGRVPSYECVQLHKQRGGPACQSARGDIIDAAVGRLFLEAIQPAHLEVSLATLETIENQAQEVERQRQLRLERARYEADLARRRFVAVDPENRLVARNLEKDWNEKLAVVEQLKRDQTQLSSPAAAPLSLQERQRILKLAEDLPTLWHASTTTALERKQLLRLLIKDVTLTKRETTIAVAIRWQTEACMSIEVSRPPRASDACRTPPAIVDRIRSLAQDHTDRQIADQLNSEGYRSGKKGSFTAPKVKWIRYVHQITSNCPENPARCPEDRRGDGRYGARAAATILNVTVSTIADWCKSGKLDGIQASPKSPWWVRLTAEDIRRLRKPAPKQRKKRPSK